MGQYRACAGIAAEEFLTGTSGETVRAQAKCFAGSIFHHSADMVHLPGNVLSLRAKQYFHGGIKLKEQHPVATRDQEPERGRRHGMGWAAR